MKNTGLEGRENLSQIVAFLHSPFAKANGKWWKSQSVVTLNFNSKKNIFHSRIAILLVVGALAILVAAPPNHPHLPMAAQQPFAKGKAAALPPLKWRYRRSVADPTTLSSEALELLTKRHFYEQQKTRDQWYKTFYVCQLKYFTIASAFHGKWRRLAFATGFAIRWSEMANGQPSLMLADEARSLPLSKKTRLTICHFASAKWQSLAFAYQQRRRR